MINSIESYLVVLICGFIIGVYVSKLYYNRYIVSASLGKLIEFSLIGQPLDRLRKQSRELNELMGHMMDIGLELQERLKESKDMENIYSDNFKTTNSKITQTVEEIETEAQ